MAYDVNKVLNVAFAEVGYLEKETNKNLDSMTANAGDMNYTKYWRDIQPSYQKNAWCLCFVDWCFWKAYGDAIAKKLLCMESGYTFYTPTSANYFKKKGQWHSTPRVGDLIFFKNSVRICHVGLVYKVTSTTVYTVEGNTSGASGVIANGGGVRKKSYTIGYSRIAGYGRPNYGVGISSAATSSKNYLSKGDIGSDVKELQKNLNKLGYNCGVVDGDFGTKTDVAVRAFQKDKGLAVDGQVGNNTIAKINECLNALNNETNVSNKIKDGQHWLNLYYKTQLAKYCGGTLVEDGQYGTKTRNACVCVWKDVVNRKYGSSLTPSNFNFYDSSIKVAKKAEIAKGDGGTLPLIAQLVLAGKGYYTGEMDGKFGDGTVDAVNAFRKKYGMSQTGKIDATLWSKLFN